MSVTESRRSREIKRIESEVQQVASISPYVHRCAAGLITQLPDYVMAISAIEAKHLSLIQKQDLDKNRFFFTYEKLFTKDWRWKGGVVGITKDSFKDAESVQDVLDRVKEIVRPLYELADEILNAELSGIATHNLDNHIEFVLAEFNNLCDLVEESTGITVSQKDRLIGGLTILIHDVAQGVSGRDLHEMIAAIIGKQLLIAEDDEGQEIIERVTHFAETHVTKKYDFDEDEASMPYAGAVLADEAHIRSTRLTEEGKRNFLDGHGDTWKFLNYFSIGSKWVLDEQRKPQWQVQLSLDELQYIEDFVFYPFVITQDGPVTEDTFSVEYVRVFSKEVLGKINPLKSAIRKLFGSTEFSVCFIDQDKNELSKHYFGRLTTMQPRKQQ